ncbi:hypothetical protein GKG47_08935 [Lactonifactor sp. BIOML-A3]|uniref:hypothetical protein n=1 Tax=unclassified Lactonifactor TaxID=2636670 RepID=UPI0012B0BB7B|nr:MULTISPECIES: hypothetical protein [unclassified Lactonifactor]MSA02165.1 hypothetical protein [Lactonifactor sp. BIOML-A5]MSA07950.1 hypothetical protein [Lactonifactor sp. BIOML-A4]MSA12566.1 hypothetical protein [Lactonifactor sp. BIOML-A3]MSA16733.1 hypothetical protein [Lactonifactor sp. BIOML-A2]MSA37568.1 hypothetical protein [Lactonifactor sp. BIOML-A1]
MKRLEFKSVLDFTKRVCEVYEDETANHYVSVYGKYDFIKQVLQNLIVNGYPIGNEIELQDFEVDNYDKEFVLYLVEDGIIVEKVWHEKNEFHEAMYFYGYSNVAFVHDECNSALLKYVESKYVFEVAIAEDDVDDPGYRTNTIETVHISYNDRGLPCGFSKAWTTSENGVICSSAYLHFSNDIDILNEVAEKFGVKL